MKVGYLASSAILVGLFVLSLLAQLRARAFHPALYWLVILSTSTAGTTMSDFMNRTAELGYATGSIVLVTGLAAVFGIWRLTGNSFDVDNVRVRRRRPEQADRKRAAWDSAPRSRRQRSPASSS